MGGWELDIPPSCEWIWGGITNWMHPVPVPIVIMLVLTYVGSHHHDACSRSDADPRSGLSPKYDPWWTLGSTLNCLAHGDQTSHVEGACMCTFCPDSRVFVLRLLPPWPPQTHP